MIMQKWTVKLYKQCFDMIISQAVNIYGKDTFARFWRKKELHKE